MRKCKPKNRAVSGPSKKTTWYKKIGNWLKKKPININVTFLGGSAAWALVVFLLIFIAVPIDLEKLQAVINMLHAALA